MTTQTNDTSPSPALEQTQAQQPTSDARNWSTLSHLSAFVMFFGIPSFVGPLVMWLLRRDEPYIDHHAKEALNFNISFMIYGFASAFLIIFLVGLLLLPAVLITWFVLVIVAATKAAAGEHYRYPFTLHLVS